MSINSATKITLGELCSLTGFSKTWINRLAADGYFKAEGHGVYKLGAVINGLLKHAKGKRKTAPQADASRRLMLARAAEIEQRTALEASTLMYSADHRAILDLLIGGLRAEIESLPAQLTRDRVLRGEYEEKINTMMGRLSDRWERAGRELQAQVDEQDAAEDE